jgi:hypothetical protein
MVSSSKKDFGGSSGAMDDDERNKLSAVDVSSLEIGSGGGGCQFSSFSASHDGSSSVSKPGDASIEDLSSAATRSCHRTMNSFTEDYLKAAAGTHRFNTHLPTSEKKDFGEENPNLSMISTFPNSVNSRDRKNSFEALQEASTIIASSEEKKTESDEKVQTACCDQNDRSLPPRPPGVLGPDLSPEDMMKMIPPSPPSRFGSASPRWTPGPAGARRKMVPITRVPSKRGLLSSSRQVNSSTQSLVSATSTITSQDNTYFTETDPEDEDYDTMSNISEETEDRVIPIGIIANTTSQDRNGSMSSLVSRDEPVSQPTRQKSERQLNEEAVSELVACDLAKQEHDLKMKTKQAGASAGRRLSVPSLRPPAVPIKSNNTRMSMPTFELSDVDVNNSSLSSLGKTEVMPPPIQPVLTSEASTLLLNEEQSNLSQAQGPSVNINNPSRPSLRTRKSGGLRTFLSSGGSNHSDESDRQAKLRAAMGSMRGIDSSNSGFSQGDGSQESFTVTARKPPARSSRLERQSSSDVELMVAAGSSPVEVNNTSESSDRRTKLQAARSALSRTGSGSSATSQDGQKFVVTPRKPPARHPPPPFLEREMSCASMSVSSGIDLDPELRDSIIARSAAQAQRRRSEREAGMATPLSNVARVSSTASSATNGSGDFSIDNDDDSRKLPSRAVLPRASRPSDEKAAFRGNPSAVGAGSMSSTGSVTARSRPSDEKAGFRRNPSAVGVASMPSAGSVTARSRPSDEKAAFRRNPSAVGDGTAASVESVTARSRPSDEKAAFRRNPSAVNGGTAASIESVTARSRPSDEKAAFRRNPSAISAGSISSAESVTARSRPSDEKAAFRRNPSATIADGTAASVESGTLCSRPSDEKAAFRRNSSTIQPEHSNVPSSDLRPIRDLARMESALRDGSAPGAITTTDVNRDLEELRATQSDLEAQAGVPVVLPGAFAIDGVENQDDVGYDSGFENDSISTRSDDDGALPPTIQVSVPASSTPLEAELYENTRDRDAIDAAEVVPTNGDDEEVETEKDKKRIRLIQIVSVLFCIVIVVIIVLSTTLTTVLRTTTEKQGPPELEGWVQLGDPIIGPTEEDNSRFGYELSMAGDGHRMAVGAPGHDGDVTMISVGSVSIMDFNGTEWKNIWTFEGPGQNAEAGKAVAISRDGNRLAFGVPGWEGGQVELYEVNSQGSWNIVGDPISNPSDVGGTFGDALAISGDGSIVAIGNRLAKGEEGSSDIGNVVVYRFTNSTWSLMGNVIQGVDPGDFFGWSIDLSSDGRRLVATAPGRNDFTGAAYCFDFDGTEWKQSGSTINGEFSRENFGASVALSDDGSVMSVGATGFSPVDVGVGVGRVRAFAFDSFTKEWKQMGQALEGTNKFDSFGNSVALSSYGDTMAIGGPENDLLGDNAGHVQVHRFNGLDWVKVGSDLGQYDFSEAEGGELGFSVALSSDGTRVAGGAPFYNFNGFVSDVGQVLVFEVGEV